MWPLGPQLLLVSGPFVALHVQGAAAEVAIASREREREKETAPKRIVS